MLFGSTLLGVLGALLAIPVAASLQIAMREYLGYRTTGDERAAGDADAAGEPSA